VELEVGVVDEAGNKGAQARREFRKPSRIRLKDARWWWWIKSSSSNFQPANACGDRLLLIAWTVRSRQVRGQKGWLVG